MSSRCPAIRTRALDRPPARVHHESPGAVGAFDDLDPDSMRGERACQCRALVGGVRPDQFQQASGLGHERLDQFRVATESCTFAGVTAPSSRRPPVSVRMWRLRPSRNLLPSIPRVAAGQECDPGGTRQEAGAKC